MYRLKQLLLVIGDVTMLYLGLYLAIWLRYFNQPSVNTINDLFWPMSFLFFFAIIIMFITGLYDLGQNKNTRKFYQKIIISALLWIGCGIIFFYIKQNVGASPKTILALNALVGFGLISLWRYFYNKYFSVTFLKTNIIFAGVTDEVKELINILKNQPQRGYSVVGLISKNQTECAALNVTCGQTIEEINVKNLHNNAGLIVLSPHLANDETLYKELYANLFKQVSIVSLSDFYEEIMGRIPPFTFSENWFITHLNEQEKKGYDRLRILIDYVGVIFFGLIFILSFPFVAAAVKFNSKGPIFFKQERVGRKGKIFKVYKYRTMLALSADGSAETAGPQYATNKDKRITSVGKFLRSARVDELPQIINIIKGEMAIIGPRPERPEFVSQLTEKMPYYALRHLIKPGLTGWAQLHKAYYGTIEENLRKLEYDLFYIKNRGLSLDISIALRTISVVARMMGR